MSKTQTFTINSDGNVNAYISVNMKVNTHKQAKERFLKKYKPVLFGYWLFSIADADGVEVGYFEIDKMVNDMANSEMGNKTVTVIKHYKRKRRAR